MKFLMYWLMLDAICAVILFMVWLSDMKYAKDNPEDQPKTPEGWHPENQSEEEKELQRVFGVNYYIYYSKRGDDDGSRSIQ